MGIIGPLRYLLSLLLAIFALILGGTAISNKYPSQQLMRQQHQGQQTSLVSFRKKAFDSSSSSSKLTDDAHMVDVQLSPLYGVEIAFLYPAEVYHRTEAYLQENKGRRRSAEEGESSSYDKKKAAGRHQHSPTSEAMNDIVQKLQEAGLSAIRSAHKIVGSASNNDKQLRDDNNGQHDMSETWKIQQERFGFEVASPIAPSFRDVETMLSVIQDFGCFVHPELTSMHVNVDARNRSLEEARNVYKNIIAIEPTLDHLRFTKKSTVLGGEAANMGEAFHSTEEAYDSLDKSTSFQSLLHLGQQYEDEDALMEEQQVKYKVGMKLKIQNYTVATPKTFEFRGLEASFDPQVAISWLKLVIELVGTSYEGNVLEPFQRTDDEAWSAVFGGLVLDASLEEFFYNRRTTMKKERLRQKKSVDLLEIQGTLCRIRDSITTDVKLFRRTYCV
jgi:hypothetical protein